MNKDDVHLRRLRMMVTMMTMMVVMVVMMLIMMIVTAGVTEWIERGRHDHLL